MRINNKRGVSEVVASVLLILLVIASIVILWAVYQRFIEGTTEGIADSGDCIQTDLDIVNVNMNINVNGDDTIRIKRVLGSATITAIRVLVNGANVASVFTPVVTGMQLGEETTATITAGTIAPGNKVEVSATVNGVACAISDEYLVP